MIEIYNWCVMHWDELLALYAGLVTVASIVVKLTPTLRDDTVLKSIVRFVGRYIALNR